MSTPKWQNIAGSKEFFAYCLIYILWTQASSRKKEDFIPLQNNGNVKRNMMNVFCRVSNPATQCS